jgi:hypothetical protein
MEGKWISFVGLGRLVKLGGRCLLLSLALLCILGVGPVSLSFMFLLCDLNHV